MLVKKISKMMIICICAMFFFSADPPIIKLAVVAPYLDSSISAITNLGKEYVLNQVDAVTSKMDISVTVYLLSTVKASNVADYYERVKFEAKKSGASFVLCSVILKSLSGYTLDVALIKVSDGSIASNQLTQYKNVYDISGDSTNSVAQLVSEELGLFGSSGSIEMWSFTDELKSVITDYEKKYPGKKINLTITPAANYIAAIQPVLASGQGAPDLFTGEAAFFRLFIDTKYWEDLGASPYNGLKLAQGKIFPYILDAAKDAEGKLRGLSCQSTAGTLIVRRDIAQEVLGTDDPAAVSEYTSSWEGFWKLAKLINEKTGGKKYITADVTSELLRLAYAGRTAPWIVNNKFVLDSGVLSFLKEAKVARDNRYDARYPQWSGDWSASMQNGEIFCYVLPSWGLRYVVMPNAPKQKGNYVLVTPPSAYYWGGTWIGIYSKAPKANKLIAWDFIKMMCLDDEYMEGYAKKTGDFISNMNVIEKIKESFKDEYIKGQNRYDYYYDEAKKINGSLQTEYDQTVEQTIGKRLNEYLTGGIADFDTLIKAIKADVKKAYPDVKVY